MCACLVACLSACMCTIVLCSSKLRRRNELKKKAWRSSEEKKALKRRMGNQVATGLCCCCTYNGHAVEEVMGFEEIGGSMFFVARELAELCRSAGSPRVYCARGFQDSPPPIMMSLLFFIIIHIYLYIYDLIYVYLLLYSCIYLWTCPLTYSSHITKIAMLWYNLFAGGTATSWLTPGFRTAMEHIIILWHCYSGDRTSANKRTFSYINT